METLLNRSASDRQEVAAQLGCQVRKAVGVLVRAMARVEQEPGFDPELQRIVAAVEERTLYQASLAVMMRLVFLSCAEERGLLLLGEALYDRNYGVSALREQLQASAEEEAHQRRYDAWSRLLATFRAVYGGVKHGYLRLPAYGGSLFDPDRFPFLEGRRSGTTWRDTEAAPLPIDNRTVRRLLEAFQVPRARLPGGGPAEARKLGVRSLEVEQIGHVYEGLLDRTAQRATEPVLGLQGRRDKEPEIPLAKLEAMAAKGEKEFTRFLKEETGRSQSALKKGLSAELDSRIAGRFRTVCRSDPELWKRVKPFAGLVRWDDMDYPAVITTGSVYVTAGTDRHSSGAHYTPRSLTEPIVRHALEPLVYFGPAEGLPRSQWKLKTPNELLDLKICDMACGSGAFLVQTCRYLAERLQEAWFEMERAVERGERQPFKPAHELPLPATDEDRRILARRLVARRCLYGVDKNPLAAEMAKMSLWLLTLAKDKPFEFLDHAIRSGDSLVGIHDLDQLRKFNLDGKGEDHRLLLPSLDQRIEQAVELRRRIITTDAHTLDDLQAQQRLLEEAGEKLERLKLAADFLVGVSLNVGSQSDKRAATLDAAVQVSAHFNRSDLETFRQEARKSLAGHRAFHWPLEFPEVFADRKAFDGFLGNPPFINAIEGGLSDTMKTWLSGLNHNLSGTADFAFYFLAQAHSFTRPGGTVGMLMPRPFLNAGSAAKLRLDLLTSRPPSVLFSPDDSSLFAFANVRVTAVVLCKGQKCIGWVEGEPKEVVIRSENWWSSLTSCSEERPTAATHRRLGDVFDLAASMTAQIAYELKEFLEDRSDTNWPRLVTTGLIDPGKCLWGEVTCRYLKKDYAQPVIRLSDKMPIGLKRRLETSRRPKLLVAGVAGPGGRLEAFVDPRGATCGAVSTYTVTHANDSVDALERLCDYLNSDGVASLVFSELNASSMGSGLLTIKKTFLSDLRLPPHVGS